MSPSLFHTGSPPGAQPGSSLRTGSKTTFCILDSTRISTRLPGAPKKAVYTTCGNQVQGMSVGWGDKYIWTLAGQELDITGLQAIVAREIDPSAFGRRKQTR